MPFPTNLPSYTPFTTPITLAAMGHSTRHKDMERDILAIATKVGINGSADASSFDFMIALAFSDISDLAADMALRPTTSAMNTAISDAVTPVSADVAFLRTFFANFVRSGLTIPTSANLTTTIAAGVAVVNGKIINKGSTGRTFVASNDTYVYLKDDGTFEYKNVANNAGSPIPSVNADLTPALLIGIVICNGSAITGVNQGQLDPVGPTVSSTILRVCDSVGTLIYNTNPVLGMIGLRRKYNTLGTTSSTHQEATELAIPIVIPGGLTRRVRVTLQSRAYIVGGASNYMHIRMWNGNVGSGAVFRAGYFGQAANDTHFQGTLTGYTDIAGSGTIRISIASLNNTNQVHLQADTTPSLGEPIDCAVELV